jgi:hypothetical protein
MASFCVYVSDRLSMKNSLTVYVPDCWIQTVT